MKKKIVCFVILFMLIQQQLYRIHANIIVKDDQGNGIQDVTFIFKDDNYQTIQLTTNQHGYIDTSNLSLTTYKIKEIQVPVQYEQKQVYYDYHPKKDLTIVHKEKKGTVLLMMLNEEKKPCMHYEFVIYNEKNEKIKTVKTDENGQIYLENMKLGLYTLTYTGNDTYKIKNDNLSFRITAYNYNKTMKLTYYLIKFTPDKTNMNDFISRIVVGIICSLICIILMIQFRKEYYSS